jgi:rhodanese-related sulfurtransferase
VPGRPALRRVVDGAIIALLLMSGWRVFGMVRRPPNDTSRAAAAALTPAVKVGDVVRLPGVVWTAPRTVVLVVSSTCRSCNDNLPFYQRVVATTPSPLQVVAVSVEPETVIGKWLGEHRVEVGSIHRVEDLLSHGLTLTPMVLIVDGEGRATDVMIRRLNEPDQAKVLERIRHTQAPALDNSQQIRELSTNDLAAMKAGRRIQILDVRPREQFLDGHRGDARNIPSRELGARAPIEVDSRVPVIVDCLQPGAATSCRSAAWTLLSAGFDDVSMLIR